MIGTVDRRPRRVDRPVVLAADQVVVLDHQGRGAE